MSLKTKQNPPYYPQCPSCELLWAPGGDTVLSQCETLRCPAECWSLTPKAYQMQPGSEPAKQLMITMMIVTTAKLIRTVFEAFMSKRQKRSLAVT